MTEDTDEQKQGFTVSVYPHEALQSGLLSKEYIRYKFAKKIFPIVSSDRLRGKIGFNRLYNWSFKVSVLEKEFDTSGVPEKLQSEENESD